MMHWEVDPRDVISSFIAARVKLDSQSSTQMKLIFLQAGTTKWSEVTMILPGPNQLCSHWVYIEDDSHEDYSNNISTKFM